MKFFQEEFDSTIGRLDRVLSLMIGWAQDFADGSAYIDSANAQTLKHHAEDMVGAGNKILSLLALSCSAPNTIQDKP